MCSKYSFFLKKRETESKHNACRGTERPSRADTRAQCALRTDQFEFEFGRCKSNLTATLSLLELRKQLFDSLFFCLLFYLLSILIFFFLLK